MRDAPKDKHTLADHAYGQDLAHVHDGDADHDHDRFEDGPLEENPIWLQDHVSLTTVGIDVGSSGTQVIFSRLELRRMGEDLSSRYYVVARETLHQSPCRSRPTAARSASTMRRSRPSSMRPTRRTPTRTTSISSNTRPEQD